MKLLCVVLNSEDKMEEVLEGLIEVGVTGSRSSWLSLASVLVGLSLALGKLKARCAAGKR